MCATISGARASAETRVFATHAYEPTAVRASAPPQKAAKTASAFRAATFANPTVPPIPSNNRPKEQLVIKHTVYLVAVRVLPLHLLQHVFLPVALAPLVVVRVPTRRVYAPHGLQQGARPKLVVPLPHPLHISPLLGSPMPLLYVRLPNAPAVALPPFVVRAVRRATRLPPYRSRQKYVGLAFPQRPLLTRLHIGVFMFVRYHFVLPRPLFYVALV